MTVLESKVGAEVAPSEASSCLLEASVVWPALPVAAVEASPVVAEVRHEALAAAIEASEEFSLLARETSLEDSVVLLETLDEDLLVFWVTSEDGFDDEL